MLGLAVNIDFDGAAGKISIRYETLEQLDDILQRLTHGKAGEMVGDDSGTDPSDSDENEFDSMFIEDDEAGSLAENDDEDVLTAELESIADAAHGTENVLGDDLITDDAPEGDAPIEREEVGEDALEEVADGTGKKPERKIRMQDLDREKMNALKALKQEQDKARAKANGTEVVVKRIL
tara:strand:- start:185 stop:721 length:537 start_codon:yes stop_codon:yes gene_type:complete